MSSRDKVLSATTTKASSSKISSHKVQSRQHQLGSGASNKTASSTVLSRNDHSCGNKNGGSQTKQAASSEQQPTKKPAGRQRALAKGAVVEDTQQQQQQQQRIDSSRGGLQKFSKLQEDSTETNNNKNAEKTRSNINEMAAVNYPTNSAMHMDETEQETDVDEYERKLANENVNENTSLLLTAASNPKSPDIRGKRESEATNNADNAGSGNSEAPTKHETQPDDPLPPGWEQHTDQVGLYFWHVSTGVIQRTRPSSELPSRRGSSVVVYHDDEEINQAPKTSSDEDDYYESGAALTLDDTSESTFVVYPLGCCEFDETQLMSATSSKAIQKCILRLSNRPPKDEEAVCWGLDQSQPMMMKLFDDHIQFTDLKTQLLLRSQPIQTIKTWAVDDNNNFAFVIEDRTGSSASSAANGGASSDHAVQNGSYLETIDYALISEPVLMCYVFRSVDEDDMMSCKVAAKLNEEINRYKEQMLNRMTKSTRLQQMVEVTGATAGSNDIGSDDNDDFDEMEASNELTMNVKYIGKFQVPRPTGIDVLNVAIDKCLADATTAASVAAASGLESGLEQIAPRPAASSDHLIEAKLHVSPSSVIVENVTTGEIIVECRIRYLTFMGISKRDIRWCGFIMQNATNKTFVAHCFECYPTAGHVCEAIQLSCSRMYEKVVKNSRQPETMSIIPTSSRIRNTLAKTLSRIKLNPLR